MNNCAVNETQSMFPQVSADDSHSRLADLRKALEALGMTPSKVDAIVAEVAQTRA